MAPNVRRSTSIVQSISTSSSISVSMLVSMASFLLRSKLFRSLVFRSNGMVRFLSWSGFGGCNMSLVLYSMCRFHQFSSFSNAYMVFANEAGRVRVITIAVIFLITMIVVLTGSLEDPYSYVLNNT